MKTKLTTTVGWTTFVALVLLALGIEIPWGVKHDDHAHQIFGTVHAVKVIFSSALTCTAVVAVLIGLYFAGWSLHQHKKLMWLTALLMCCTGILGYVSVAYLGCPKVPAQLAAAPTPEQILLASSTLPNPPPALLRLRAKVLADSTHKLKQQQSRMLLNGFTEVAALLQEEIDQLEQARQVTLAAVGTQPATPP